MNLRNLRRTEMAQRRLYRRRLGRGIAHHAAVFDAKVAAAGWLVGFAFWAQILLGSLTLT